MDAEAKGLRQDWVRELFTGFCGWDRLPRRRGDMPKRIGAYAAFFAALDGVCTDAGEITQARLFELHGAEGLRRHHLPVRFLADRLALAWHADALEAAIEGRRVDATIAAAAGRPWAADLESYRAHLSAGREIAPNTARMYVAAAAGLLESSGVERASELNHAHVARRIRRSPGRKANLLRFLSWIADVSGQAFDVGPIRRTPPRKRERATLRKAGRLLDRLAAAHDPREGRAVLAAAIAVLHHVPLKRVLALCQRDVAADGDSVTLWPGEADVKLAAPLVAGIRRFAGLGPLAFPGHNGVQPLTVSAVRHHQQT